MGIWFAKQKAGMDRDAMAKGLMIRCRIGLLPQVIRYAAYWETDSDIRLLPTRQAARGLDTVKEMRELKVRGSLDVSDSKCKAVCMAGSRRKVTRKPNFWERS